MAGDDDEAAAGVGEQQVVPFDDSTTIDPELDVDPAEGLLEELLEHCGGM